MYIFALFHLEHSHIAKWLYNSFDRFAGFATNDCVKLSKLCFKVSRCVMNFLLLFYCLHN